MLLESSTKFTSLITEKKISKKYPMLHVARVFPLGSVYHVRLTRVRSSVRCRAETQLFFQPIYFCLKSDMSFPSHPKILWYLSYL